MAIPDLPLGVRLLVYLGAILSVRVFFGALFWTLDYLAVDRYVDAYAGENGLDSDALGSEDSPRPLPHESAGPGPEREPADNSPDEGDGPGAVACPVCGAPSAADTTECVNCDADLPQ